MPWTTSTHDRPGAKPAPTRTGIPASRAARSSFKIATVSASPSHTITAGRPAVIVCSTAANCVPRGLATTTASASSIVGKGWCSITTRSPIDRAVRANTSGDTSRRRTWSTLSEARSCRATLAPTAPAPRTATRISADPVRSTSATHRTAWEPQPFHAGAGP